MKQYEFQLAGVRTRKTVSDLKLKKSIQATDQQLEIAKINNSLKFRAPKLTPILGQITVIPIKPESAIVKQMLLGKQVLRFQGPLKKLKNYQQSERKQMKTQAKQYLKSDYPELINNSPVLKNQSIIKAQQSIVLNLQQKLQLSLVRQTKRTKIPVQTNSKGKNLPKIQSEQKIASQKSDRPLLPGIDPNLKSIKSLHFFMLQHETKCPVIAYRSKTKIEVASLTKIMTFYTVYRICEQFRYNPKEVEVKIEYHMTDISGTSALLQQNQVYTLEQLLYGLMLPSGNDAALALATWGGMSLKSNAQPISDRNTAIKCFIQKMNQLAKQLKMNDTSYGNPHGLPHKDNRTTCQDMAKLCSICLDIPLFRQIVSTKVYKFKIYHLLYKRRLASHWENTNKLLRRPGFIGIKTGITVTAGPCLASAYEFMGKTYIVIIAKCNKPSRRFKETRKLLVHCLERINHDKPLQKQDQITLKKLSRTNEDIDSDYSEDQVEFNFTSFSPQQIKRRTRILTQI